MGNIAQDREEQDVKDLIKDHRLDDISIIRERVSHILRLENPSKNTKNLNIPRNASMFDNELLQRPKGLFPADNADVLLASLMSSWKRDMPNKNLGLISEQSAKTMELLRKMGYMQRQAYKNEERYTYNVDGKNFTYYDEDGVLCRRIDYFIEPLVCPELNYFKASDKSRKQWRKGRVDPHNGKTTGLEDDHRTPVTDSLKRGGQPATLTENDIISGIADKYFQVFHHTTNKWKRECCEKCHRGEQIEKPMNIPWDAYKQFKLDNEEDCEGCYWHNILTPQFPEKWKLENVKEPFLHLHLIDKDEYIRRLGIVDEKQEVEVKQKKQEVVKQEVEEVEDFFDGLHRLKTKIE